MEKILQLIGDTVSDAFEKAGYDRKFGTVTISNRPDMCEYQCNGALAASKQYRKNPMEMAEEVAKILGNNPMLEKAEAVKPGFLNMNISGKYLAKYTEEMLKSVDLGVDKKTPDKIIIDYGGPNVAKPLHVGHLRSAIIGECLKRMGRALGDEVIGDVHLGDWGLQMGLIMAKMMEDSPELVYFDKDFTGEYPKVPPFTIDELEKIYPAASEKSKQDEEFYKKALHITGELQKGNPGYMALWNHILSVSVADLKKNYEKLDVEFDLWKKESDVQQYIPDMIEDLKSRGYAKKDRGALIIDVAQEGDQKEIPPCIIQKTDGSSLYATTDLATILEREKLYNPDKIIYVVDKRQEMHFTQVFRAVKKTGIARDNTRLIYVGFGTINGKDGRPFKTREGGIMRLSALIGDIEDKMLEKMLENRKEHGIDSDSDNIKATADVIALAAIKYADLSNQAAKDYIFDIDKFTSFEGNTGPYILYTMVRIKSILERCRQSGIDVEKCSIKGAFSKEEKDLMIKLAMFNECLEGAYRDLAPHKLCTYIYGLSNDFNRLYHERKILQEENAEIRESLIGLINLCLKVLEKNINILGFSAPERM